ncbi:alpha/beta hydrolase [Arenibacter sp. M-2]|uniref:alpha/beta hydrolase n=1 Tax=Arenibacter sp. M-2 TaxID=3053612 RepID=UPI00257115CB|nr:alpha/beta hydrolase [Arenibacter sp. M-2]MDL5513047.1 alpha/beta hydrolase [Arenibacter sp. M-2]|tara:strand:- start:26162 stop:27073 length:912 start_codon:yes stop_codon:yes gene_type:complete
MKKWCILMLILSSYGYAQEIIPIWKNGVVNTKESDEMETIIEETDDILLIAKVQKPTIEVYLPSKRNATGQAVVICPGGGYTVLAYDWEGTDIAKWLNSRGIAAFVLKYRLPNSKSIAQRNEAPLQDAQRALRLVRHNAKKWNINAEKIGVMGFSAGGHLASTLGTQFDRESFSKKDEIDSLSARPNFMILLYPVITMKEPYANEGSKLNLLGQNPSDEVIMEYSSELQVKNNTPPTFIVHSADDTAVPIENSLFFFKALNEKGVAAEMHIYPSGGHGYSLASGDKYLQTWVNRLEDWLNNLP